MTIENFNSTQFAAALPTVGKAKWCQAGVANGQLVYTVHPPGTAFGLYVWSSIDPDTGVSKAGAGYDSIRAVCCQFDDKGQALPYGGKAARWTDRRPGWQGRLCKVLALLAGQLKHLRPCPKCAANLVPFTAKNGQNKGRPFVACKNKTCKGDEPFGFFEWADVPSDPPQFVQDASETVKPASESIPALETALCVCGATNKVLVSRTVKNPGRKFTTCKCGKFTWIEKTHEGCTVIRSGGHSSSAYLRAAIAALDKGDEQHATDSVRVALLLLTGEKGESSDPY